MTATFYNEHDPFAAAWLRNLWAAGCIADGVVDERSVADLKAADLEPFDRAHFFAGLGGWDHALRLAGWPESAPVWTGSCPCQPWSVAGKRKGTDDVRHLWPVWFKLIAERAPPVVFGEQVSSPDGLRWFDAVSADLEAAGYAVGAVDTCAAGVGAPHLRQRLYFVAVADGGSRDLHLPRREPKRAVLDASGDGGVGGVADADGGVTCDGRLQRGGEHGLVAQDGGTRWVADADECARGQEREVGGRGDHRGVEESRTGSLGVGELGLVGDADEPGSQGWRVGRNGGNERPPRTPVLGGFWRDAEWLYCCDGKWRATQPGVHPLAHGFPNRVGLLRGAGNAIVPQQAAAFVTAFMQTRGA